MNGVSDEAQIYWSVPAVLVNRATGRCDEYDFQSRLLWLFAVRAVVVPSSAATISLVGSHAKESQFPVWQGFTTGQPSLKL